MANYPFVEIGGHDYGPLGVNVLVKDGGINLKPATQGRIGTATVRLYKKAGIPYLIQVAQVCRIYLKDTSTNRITFRYFIGTVSRVRTGRIKGTNIKTWDIDLQDANLAWAVNVTDAAYAPALHLSAATFTSQIIQLFDYFGTGADVPIDASTYVPDLLSGATLDAKIYQGYTLWEVLQDIFIRAKAINPALSPAATLRPEKAAPSLPGASFGPPILDVWDRAIPRTPVKKFSDLPDGTHFAIVQDPEFSRVIEAALLVNYRESTAPSGRVYTYTDTASLASYKNPYSGRHGKAWMAKPVQDSQSQSAAEADAKLKRLVQKTSQPRETVPFATWEPVYPGDPIALTWALEDLAEAAYDVASVSISFKIWNKPLYVVEAGSVLLEAGDTGDNDILAAPHSGSGAAPNPPAAVAVSSNTFAESIGRSQIGITVSPSPSADTDHYIAHIEWPGASRTYNMGKDSNNNPILVWLFDDLPPSTVVGIQAKTVDVNGNESDYTVPISPTTASPPSLAAPTGIALNTAANWGGYRWDNTGVVAAISWTPNASADHYDWRVVDTSTGREVAFYTTIGNTAGTEAGFMSRGSAAGFDFYVRSVSHYGYSGAWAAALHLTAPSANPRYPNGLASIHPGRDKLGRARYTLSWTIPPPATNTYNGTPASFWILIKDALDNNVIYYQTAIPLTQSQQDIPPLPAGVNYLARVGTQEQYGDFGALSSPLTLTLAVPAVPAGIVPTMDIGDGASTFEYWRATTGPAPSTESTDVDTGNRAIRVSAIASSGHSILESLPLTIPAAAGVKLSLAAKGPQTSNSWIMDCYFSWRDKSGIQIGTTAIPIATPTNAWIAADYSAIPPGGTYFVVIHLDAQNKLAGTADILWNLRDWDLQAVAADYSPSSVLAAALAAGAVIPSRQRNSSIENVIPNGSLEIPDVAGTAPDGYTLTGTWTWLSDATGLAVGDGVRAIRLGGAAGSHTLESPKFEYTGGQTNAANYGFHFRMLAIKAIGGTVDWLRLQFYDKDGVYLDYEDIKTNDGSSNLAASILTAWVQLDGQVAPAGVIGHTIPTNAVYATVKISYTTTTTGQLLTLDRLEGEYSVNVVSAADWQIRRPGGLLAGSLNANNNVPELDFYTAMILADFTNGGSIRQTIGSSNPASPATGQRHYRTDLHLWIFWDGSRWLTEQTQRIDGWLYYPGSAAVVGNEISTSIGELLASALRSDYAFRAERAELYGFVGTNNGTNYWTIELRTFTGLATMTTFSTAGWTGGQWNRSSAVTSFSNHPSTGDYGMEIVVTKVNAPGNLRFYFNITGRLVIT